MGIRKIWFHIFFFIGVILHMATPVMATPADELRMAKEALEKGALIIDVRTEAEYREGHAKGALNIPHDELSRRVDEIKEHQDRPVVVYCRSGGRSEFAEGVLKNLGFQEVINAGGLEEMKQLTCFNC